MRKRRIKNSLYTLCATLACVVIVCCLLAIVAVIVREGIGALNWKLITQ